MKIGVFDSGLGGIVVMSGIMERLPQYDYVYLGDTARVPYGTRSQKTIYEFTKQGIEALFKKGCGLVIVACNTASAEALRTFQQEDLINHPDKKVLGVLIPAAEAAVQATKNKRVGVIATPGTVRSMAFEREIDKIDNEIKVYSQPTPLLVPLIEHGGIRYVQPILNDYLQPILNENVDTLVLGCTHYPLIRKEIEEIIGPDITIIAQDECVPPSLEQYLQSHNDLQLILSTKSSSEFYVTDPVDSYASTVAAGLSQLVTFKVLSIEPDADSAADKKLASKETSK